MVDLDGGCIGTAEDGREPLLVDTKFAFESVDPLRVSPVVINVNSQWIPEL